MTGWWNHEVLALGSHSIPVLFLLSRLVLHPLIHEGRVQTARERLKPQVPLSPTYVMVFLKNRRGRSHVQHRHAGQRDNHIRDEVRFHHTLQKGTQFKSYELFLSENSHLMFSHGG